MSEIIGVLATDQAATDKTFTRLYFLPLFAGILPEVVVQVQLCNCMCLVFARIAFKHSNGQL